jgi:hypothetical protein
MKHTTMETLVTSIDNAEYLKYRGRRYLKLGEGVWNMDFQSSAMIEKRRAPHLSMSSEMGSLRVQLKQANDELTSGNDDGGSSVVHVDEEGTKEDEAAVAAAAAMPTITPSTCPFCPPST